MLPDTGNRVDLLRGHPSALAWLRALPQYPAVSGVGAIELLWGAANSAELRAVERFLSPMPVAWPTQADIAAAAGFAALHLVHGIDAMDAITASVCARTGLAVATFNAKHFSAVSGASTVQPYVR